MPTLSKRLEALEARPAAQGEQWVRIAIPCGDGFYTVRKQNGTAHILSAAELAEVSAAPGPRVIVLDR